MKPINCENNDKRNNTNSQQKGKYHNNIKYASTNIMNNKPLTTFTYFLTKHNKRTLSKYPSESVFQCMKFNNIVQANQDYCNNSKFSVIINNKLKEKSIRCNLLNFKYLPHFHELCKDKLNSVYCKEKASSQKIYQNMVYRFKMLSINNKIFKVLNHLKFKEDELHALPSSCVCGLYCNHGLPHSPYNSLKNWMNQPSRSYPTSSKSDESLCKMINICTVTKENTDPYIVPGLRYFNKANLKKINFILNHCNRGQDITFDINTPTFGIKVTGPTNSSRHHGSIMRLYNQDWNALIKHRPKQTVHITEYQLPQLSSPISPLSIIKSYKQYNLNDSSVYIFGYHLNSRLQSLSVTSFKYANYFLQFRLMPGSQNKGARWVLRIIIDRDIFRQTQNYIKLTLFIITSKIYESLSDYAISLHSWQGYYEVFLRPIEPSVEKSFCYKYIDKSNTKVHTIDNVTAKKHECYILVDPQEIEPRLQTELNRKNINLNNDTSNYKREDISQGDGECDIFIQLPIDVFIWIIILSNIKSSNKQKLREISAHKIQAYFRMIKSSGTAHHSTTNNRIKHMESWQYKWGTSQQAHQSDVVKGLRKPWNDEPTSLYYLCEHDNLHCLGEDTTFSMNACNLYHGPGSSEIGNHTEYWKFEGYIWTKTTGESSRLIIGSQRRALGSNFLWSVPSQHGYYAGYKADGLSMRVSSHGIHRNHLSWIEYDYRLADIYRFVRKELIPLAIEHRKNCPKNDNNPNWCECVKSEELYTPKKDLPTINDMPFRV